MISFFKRLFFDNWQRKLISLILAIIIWVVTNYSVQVNKEIAGVSARVINLPEGKTIEGMLGNGVLETKVCLNLIGNKERLDELSSKNLEVLIDASQQPDQWIAVIDKKNLHCTNPEIDLGKTVLKVVPQEMILRQTKKLSEKIPILITKPIGEAPKGYQFLDIWPHQLFLTVNGPEDVVRRVKNRGIKLTFNLNEVSASDLDLIQNNWKMDEISFPIPGSWKKVSIPQLSDYPLEIDDPLAQSLRLEFSKQDFFPIDTFIPISIYFPSKYSNVLNPESLSITTNSFIVKKNGVKGISIPLYARGVSRTFLETVKDMMQIAVVAAPKSERETLLWSIQFIYPYELETRYVEKVVNSLEKDDSFDIPSHMREEYLRNRFRKHMNQFRLYTEAHQKLNLRIELKSNSISVIHETDLGKE